MPHQPNTIEGFKTGGEATDAVVHVKLMTIEHKADNNNQVDNNFSVSLKITDGKNPTGNYGPEDISLQPGQQHQIDKWIFLGTYEDRCNKDVGEIKFDFIGETTHLFNTFTGVTTGNNALDSAGTHYFKAPVTLENRGKKSVLVFRGRIDVTC